MNVRENPDMAPETPATPDTPEAERQAQLQKLESLAEAVRQATRDAHVVRLDEVWTEPEEALSALLEDPELTEYQDLSVLHEGDHAYLFSTTFMTVQYATVAARKEEGDPIRLIAETVRFDSETYPRPTQMEVFQYDPYLLSPEEAMAVVEKMAQDPRYADIKLIRASNGTPYLFSADRMNSDHAQAIAEWVSVGQFDSP